MEALIKGFHLVFRGNNRILFPHALNQWQQGEQYNWGINKPFWSWIAEKVASPSRRSTVHCNTDIHE